MMRGLTSIGIPSICGTQTFKSEIEQMCAECILSREKTLMVLDVCKYVLKMCERFLYKTVCAFP